MVQFSSSDLPQLLRASLASIVRIATVEQIFRSLIGKGPNHTSMIARLPCYFNKAKIDVILPLSGQPAGMEDLSAIRTPNYDIATVMTPGRAEAVVRTERRCFRSSLDRRNAVIILYNRTAKDGNGSE